MSESMHTYLLNKATISHYDYHWFWGLRCNSHVPAKNLTIPVEELEQNASLLLSLQTQQTQVMARSVLTRFFFRWFNINNYAHNSYKLAAFDAYKEFKQEYGNAAEEEGLYPRYGVRMELLKDSSWDWATQRMIKLLFSAYRIGLRSYTAPPKSAPSKNFQPESNPIVSQHFMVKPKMLPYLKVLNIQANGGEYLSWLEVKQAFRREALCRHPDKPGGSHELFCELKEALESLKAQVYGSKPELKQQWDTYFSDAFEELSREIARAHSTLDRVDEIYVEISQTHKEISQTLKEISQTQKGISQTLKEIRQTNQEIRQTNQEMDQTLTQLEAKMAAYIQSTRSQQVEQKPEESLTVTATTFKAAQQINFFQVPSQRSAPLTLLPADNAPPVNALVEDVNHSPTSPSLPP